MATLFDYQQQCVRELLAGKHVIYAGMGLGKNPISMVWAGKKCEETGKSKILVVTTASKAKTTDHADDLGSFYSSLPKSLSSLSLQVISWHKLRAWVDANWSSLEDWVVVFDEIQRCGAGASSQMGKAFLKITKKNPDWAGFTGTPGDTWLKFYPYFVATNLVRNKTSFMAEFANVQTYKGYTEIVSWRNENKLRDMWARISYAPDTRRATQELPKSVTRPITFSLPKTYATVLKTRMKAGSDGSNYDEDFLDTPGALTAELRRICFTKDKQQWVSDFIQDVDCGAVIFYNYIATGDKLEEIITKALGKDGEIWRIDGKHHEIPTAETIGPKDMVLCQWQSGSEALNLQMLHYMVMVELPYSYSTLKQGMGRIRRLGQESTMFFYTLLCDKGIEQDVKQILQTKSDFSVRNWCISKKLIKEVKND